MTLTTRKPTGKPAWPLLLLAGVEKSGKSWASAEAAASDLIGAAYWVAIGEDEPDELGRIAPDMQIVQHDGSYQGVLGAVRAVAALPPADGKPVLLVLDSISMMWSMLTDEAQALANRRAAQKAEKQGRKAPADDVTISMDLWNRAANRWRKLMDALRAHRGPVIVTARLSQVSILDGKGEPTGDKDWKVEGHKTLPYDASVIVQLRSRAERYITGVRSAVFVTDPEALIDFPTGKTVKDLWELLGLSESTDRVHRAPDGAASLAVEDQARSALLERALRISTAEKLEDFWQRMHGESIRDASDLDALREFVEQGEAVAAERAQQATQPAVPQPAAPVVDQLPEAPEPEPQQAVEAPPQDPREEVRRGMLSAIAQHFQRLGVTDRTERIQYTAALVGRDIQSSNELELPELRRLVTGLGATRDLDHLIDVIEKRSKSNA